MVGECGGQKSPREGHKEEKNKAANGKIIMASEILRFALKNSSPWVVKNDSRNAKSNLQVEKADLIMEKDGFRCEMSSFPQVG